MGKPTRRRQWHQLTNHSCIVAFAPWSPRGFSEKLSQGDTSNRLSGRSHPDLRFLSRLNVRNAETLSERLAG